MKDWGPKRRQEWEGLQVKRHIVAKVVDLFREIRLRARCFVRVSKYDNLWMANLVEGN
jgi:hypothetical protein